MTRVTLDKPLLQAHERPANTLSPYPWGVIWIYPDGKIEYDPEKTTADYVEHYIENAYKPHLTRLR